MNVSPAEFYQTGVRRTSDDLGAMGSSIGEVFAATTAAILAKIGVTGIDSNLATAIRTTVVLVFTWLLVFMNRSAGDLTSRPLLDVLGSVRHRYRTFMALLLSSSTARPRIEGRANRQTQSRPRHRCRRDLSRRTNLARNGNRGPSRSQRSARACVRVKLPRHFFRAQLSCPKIVRLIRTTSAATSSALNTTSTVAMESFSNT